MNETPIEIAALVFAILLMIGMYLFFSNAFATNGVRAQNSIANVFQTKSRNYPDSGGRVHAQPTGNHSTAKTPAVFNGNTISTGNTSSNNTKADGNYTGYVNVSGNGYNDVNAKSNDGTLSLKTLYGDVIKNKDTKYIATIKYKNGKQIKTSNLNNYKIKSNVLSILIQDQD